MTAPVDRWKGILAITALGFGFATVVLAITLFFNLQLEFVAPRIMMTAFLLSMSVNLFCFAAMRIWQFNDARKARQEKGA